MSIKIFSKNIYSFYCSALSILFSVLLLAIPFAILTILDLSSLFIKNFIKKVRQLYHSFAILIVSVFAMVNIKKLIEKVCQFCSPLYVLFRSLLSAFPFAIAIIFCFSLFYKANLLDSSFCNCFLFSIEPWFPNFKRIISTSYFSLSIRAHLRMNLSNL